MNDDNVINKAILERTLGDTKVKEIDWTTLGMAIKGAIQNPDAKESLAFYSKLCNTIIIKCNEEEREKFYIILSTYLQEYKNKGRASNYGDYYDAVYLWKKLSAFLECKQFDNIVLADDSIYSVFHFDGKHFPVDFLVQPLLNHYIITEHLS